MYSDVTNGIHILKKKMVFWLVKLILTEKRGEGTLSPSPQEKSFTLYYCWRFKINTSLVYVLNTFFAVMVHLSTFVASANPVGILVPALLGSSTSTEAARATFPLAPTEKRRGLCTSSGKLALSAFAHLG